MTDPISAFFDELRRLHRQAGQPSTEVIAGLIGRRDFSAGVVGDALRGPRLASWAKVNLIVKALGADAGHVHPLWRAAHDAQSRPGREAPPDEGRPSASSASGSAGQDSAGPGSAGQDSAGPGSAGPGSSASGPVLDRGDLAGWMERYRPAVEEHADAAVMPPTSVERLAQLDPLSAFKALAELPPTVAARRLAALTDEQARPIVRLMGLAVLDFLIAALPSSPPRERLVELRPRRRGPATADSDYGTLAEVEKIQNLNPDLAKQWGWRS